jgi:hypothetical protein
MTEDDQMRQQADKEKKLESLLKDRMEALSKIKTMVSEQSALEKQLDSIDAAEEELDAKLLDLKRKIGETSREMDASNNEEEELVAHKKKTALLQESAKVEDELDDITRKKVDILDKVKDLTKNRSELEGTWDRVEAEEIDLKKEVMELRQKAEGFMHQMSREIGQMDRESINSRSATAQPAARFTPAPEVPPLKPKETPLPETKQEKLTPAPEKPKEMPAAPEIKAEKLKEVPPKVEKPVEKPKVPAVEPKQEQKKSIFNVFGKKEKEESDINVGMLKAVLKIMDGLLEKLPEDAIDKFSKSADYEKYEKLYHMVEEYKGTAEEKEHIKANAKSVFVTVDNLLRQLPKEVLDEFAESDDFDRYNKVLESYGVG